MAPLFGENKGYAESPIFIEDSPKPEPVPVIQRSATNNPGNPAIPRATVGSQSVLPRSVNSGGIRKTSRYEPRPAVRPSQVVKIITEGVLHQVSIPRNGEQPQPNPAFNIVQPLFQPDNKLPRGLETAALRKVQELLEQALFYFIEKWSPKTLQQQRWDAPEAGELNRWKHALIGVQFPPGSLSPRHNWSQARFISVLTSLHEIRHAAVHRKSNGTHTLILYLPVAIEFAACLQDSVRAEELRSIKHALEKKDDRSHLERVLRIEAEPLGFQAENANLSRSAQEQQVPAPSQLPRPLSHYQSPTPNLLSPQQPEGRHSMKMAGLKGVNREESIVNTWLGRSRENSQQQNPYLINNMPVPAASTANSLNSRPVSVAGLHSDTNPQPSTSTVPAIANGIPSGKLSRNNRLKLRKSKEPRPMANANASQNPQSVVDLTQEEDEPKPILVWGSTIDLTTEDSDEDMPNPRPANPERRNADNVNNPMLEARRTPQGVAEDMEYEMEEIPNSLLYPRNPRNEIDMDSDSD